MKIEDHLDRIDFAILVVLQKNARVANNRLAETVGVAPSTCLERVRRLARLGVLRGHHADVEPGALGIGLEAMIAVRLCQHSRDVVDSFRNPCATPTTFGIWLWTPSRPGRRSTTSRRG